VAFFERARRARGYNPETYRVTLPLLFLRETFPVPFMKSMLIIDGSEIISTLFSELFESRGWNVNVCADRQCVLKRLTGDWPYDAILVGQIEGTDEVHLVGLIRGFEDRKMSAVIVLAEHPEVSDDVLSAGADEVMVKPSNSNFARWAVDKHANR
jgi:DNA-binding response OmpR family regulator